MITDDLTPTPRGLLIRSPGGRLLFARCKHFGSPATETAPRDSLSREAATIRGRSGRRHPVCPRVVRPSRIGRTRRAMLREPRGCPHAATRGAVLLAAALVLATVAPPPAEAQRAP